MSLFSIRLRPSQVFLLWIFANFLGGWLVSFLENNGLQFAATLFLTGSVIGVLQWAVLRQAGSRFRWWPLASAAGWILGVVLWALSQALPIPTVDFFWPRLSVGESFWISLTWVIWIFGMAIAQTLVLGRQSHSRGIWLVASLIGGSLQAVVERSLCASACQVLPLALVGIVHGFGWAVYGAVTGLALLKVRTRLV
ncbi:MAG: hypothetical protein WA783_16615 [Phormidesmis sp.]